MSPKYGHLTATCLIYYQPPGQTVSDAITLKNNARIPLTYSAGAFIDLLASDYNNNGTVDAADYVLWRKNPSGFPAEAFATWRAHFGQTAGSGTSASSDAVVPEPAALVLSMCAAAAWCLQRGRTA